MASVWVTAVRQAMVLIDQIESDDVREMPQKDLVLLGQRLWWLIKHAEKLLGVIKDKLRQEAAGANRRFEADDSHCLVLPQKPTIELRKGLDIAEMKTKLGPRFSEFFEEVVTYKPKPDFKQRTAAADADTAALLLNAVTLNTRSARVVFKD